MVRTVETKNMRMSIEPNSESAIRCGIVPYFLTPESLSLSFGLRKEV
jgi:hypothetical protein